MAGARFPVVSKQFSETIQGRETHFVLSGYEDQILVIVTQMGKMGTILQASKEEGQSGAPTFDVSVLLGKRDEPMLVACARQLIEVISNAGSSRSLVLTLGLTDHSLETGKKIIELVVANKIW